MTYIPTQTTARADEAIRQMILPTLPDAAGVRIREGATQARVDGGARSARFFSRDKAAIRAENLETLGVIKDVVGSRLGQASLRRFEAAMGASVKRGDKPLTARQVRAAIQEEMMRNDAGGHARDLAPSVGPVLERQAYFLEKTAPPLPRQGLADAIAAGETLLAEGENAALRERLEVLRVDLRGNADPLGEGAFQEGVIGMFAAATQLLQRLPESNADKIRLLRTVNDALKDAMAAIERTAIAPGAKDVKEIKEHAQRAIGEILRQLEGMTLEGNDAPLTREDVRRLVKEANVQELNRAGRWEPIAKRVNLPAGEGQNVQVTSAITPAGHANAHFTTSYRDATGRVAGVSSTDTGNRQHAVNLARTTLTDAAGNTIFSALRHGVCSAFGIGNRAERLAANRTRAVELLTLAAQDAVRAHPGLLAQAQEGGVLEMPLVSVSLLTPDAFRIRAGNEARFLREQNAALQTLADNPPEITLDMPQGGAVRIRVRPQLATFNFPVNAAPQGNTLAQQLAGGYLTSHGQNEAAFAALVGERFMRSGNPDDLGGIVGARIRGLPPAQQAAVRELARQCRDLWQGGGHRDRTQTPYRLPARLAALTSLLGFPPAFNCKSGKDRTGQMDVEAKTIAAFLARHNRAPALDGADAAALQAIRVPLALEGGNHEMQVRNTGFAGFKTLGVRGLETALGGQMTRVIGFSRLVKD
ncbi:MAG: hypothetical protein LBU11_01495 [Zoogloeaceae bacterium]|nr:hypothetical protein [Zoogloeaceae bacterium]